MVEEVKVLVEFERLSGKKFVIFLLIVVMMKRIQFGKLRSYDLLFREFEFYEFVRENLWEKYVFIYGLKLFEDFEMRVFNVKLKCFEVKLGIFQIVWYFVFRVYGDEGLLRMGYFVGFGEKNLIGFGMVKVDVWKERVKKKWKGGVDYQKGKEV